MSHSELWVYGLKGYLDTFTQLSSINQSRKQYVEIYPFLLVNLLSLTIIQRKQRNLEMQFAISQTNVFQSLLRENPCDYEHIFVNVRLCYQQQSLWSWSKEKVLNFDSNFDF